MIDQTPPEEAAAVPDVSALPWASLGDLSPWAILALTMIALLLGWLIPVRTHNREIAAKDAVNKDLKEAVRAVNATNDVLAETNRVLARDVAEPIAKIMGSIQKQAEGAGDRK